MPYETRMVPDPASPTGYSLQQIYRPPTPAEQAREALSQVGNALGGLYLHQVGRQVALTGRYLAEGAADVAGIVTNPLAAGLAGATGQMENFQPLREVVGQGLTRLGVPEPRGAVEETVGNLSRALAAGGGVAGATRAAVPLATGAVGRGTLTELAAMPGRQLAGATTGEAARMGAEAAGAGPIGQIAASVAGGAIPFLGATQAGRTLAQVAEPEAAPAGSALRPRRPSPFDYDDSTMMPERPARPAPQTYDEALDQVRALEAELDDMTRTGMQLGQTRQLRLRGGPGESWRKDAFPARLTQGRGAIEADLAAARADLERLRPAPAERQNPPGTSEAARAYLDKLGLGNLYELGSTRRGAPDLTPPPALEPVRAEPPQPMETPMPTARRPFLTPDQPDPNAPRSVVGSMMDALGDLYRPGSFVSATGAGPGQASAPPPVASRSNLGFFSAVGAALDNPKTPGRGNADAWLGWLKNQPGVKGEELEWTGLQDWLKLQPGAVSRDDVANYVRNNGVQIEETVLGSAQSGQTRISVEEMARQAFELEWAERSDGWTNWLYSDAIDRAKQQLRQETADVQEQFDGDAYEYMQENGGVWAMFTPEELTWARDNAWDQSQDQYRQAAQDRVDEDYLQNELMPTDNTKWSSYTLPGGSGYREVLLRLPERRPTAEDIIRRDGEINVTNRSEIAPAYTSSHWDQPNVLAHVRMQDRTGPNGERLLALEEVQSDWHQAGRERGYGHPDFDEAFEVREPTIIERQRGVQDSWVVARRGETIDHIRGGGATPEQARRNALRHPRLWDKWSTTVPDAPFKDNRWASLALKRMVVYAAENGYDGVAWIPGTVKNGKVAAQPQAGWQFYDQILPNIANDIGKKYGARTGRVTLEAGRNDVPFHVLPITPQLRAQAIEKGFPIMAVPGAIGLGLAAAQGERAQAQEYGPRPDGTAKGQGFLGPIQIRNPDGSTSVATEYSVGVNIDGREMDIPTLVPTLTPEQRRRMVEDIIPAGKMPPRDIVDAAVRHARMRMEQGLSPFVD